MKAFSIALIGTLAVSAVPGVARAQLDSATIASWVHAHRLDAVRTLGRLASFPSIHDDTAGLAAARAFLQQALRRHGFTTRELIGTGVPAVFAERSAPGATTTLLLYCHYDGQPVDSTKWNTPPFVPTLFDSAGRRVGPVANLTSASALTDAARIYGRAAADDKGPIAALLTALDLLAAKGVHPSFNVKLFFEGEEESGSPGLASIVENPAYRDLLKADALIIFDGPRFQTDDPTIALGARGIVTANLTVYGAKVPLHSGHYGNWAVNPAMELSHLLASMVDESGHVLVAGFYDGRRPLSPAEQAALHALPNVGPRLKREFGIPRTYGDGMPLTELITYPSLNIRGLQSMYVGGGARTVVPDKATAALDFRLVPGISDSAVLARVRRHIEHEGYWVTTTEPTDADRAAHPKIARFVRVEGGYPSFRTAITLPAVVEVRRVMTIVGGHPPLVLPMMGGSVPLVIFERELGIPPFIVPLTNHDSNQHSPNENFRLREYFQAVGIIAGILADYGKGTTP